MDETNFDWDNLRLFLEVARTGGLANAADSTGKSAPTLGRRMLALERRLGQQLFDRQPRGYVLTDHGRKLMDVALLIEGGINPLVENAADSRHRRVKISAGTWTTHLLVQNASKLIANDPIVLQFLAADHLLDIPHREAVIGIRNQRPAQVSLAGQRLKKVQFALYATSTSVTNWAVTLGSTPSALWAKEQAHNHAVIELSHPRNTLDTALAGHARCVLPTFIGNTTEGLIQVSDEITELAHSQWLVTHQEDRHLPEVRSVIERLKTLLC